MLKNIRRNDPYYINVMLCIESILVTAIDTFTMKLFRFTVLLTLVWHT